MAKTPVVHAQQRWEYLTLVRRTDTYLADELNKLGQDGWELVSILYARDSKGELFWNSFLKRPATQQPRAASTQEKVAEAEAQPSPAAAEAEPRDARAGFDLSGDEFEIKEE